MTGFLVFILFVVMGIILGLIYERWFYHPPDHGSSIPRAPSDEPSQDP